jgi:hypothetical protein
MVMYLFVLRRGELRMWGHLTEDEKTAKLERLSKLSRATPPDLNAAYVLGIWEWRQGRRSAAEVIFLDLSRPERETVQPHSLPEFVLEMTADNPDYEWLGYQADPEELAEIASSDEGWEFHYSIAGNPNTPESAARTLIENAICDEGSAVGDNFGLPDDFYRWFAEEASKPEESPNLDALGRLAGNPAIPLSVMRALAMSEDESVRAQLATNLSIPRDLLTDLAQDVSNFVREAAQRNPFLADDFPRGNS